MRSLLSCVALLAVAACKPESTDVVDTDTGPAGPEAVQIAFKATFGAEKASCSSASAGVGTSAASVRLADFRAYLTDVSLLLSDGTEAALALDVAAPWSSSDTVLLDFGGDAGGCAGQDSLENTVVSGLATLAAPVSGLRFTIGMSRELAQIAPDGATPPLDVADMFSTAVQGREYLRVSVQDVAQGNAEWTAFAAGVGCSLQGDCQADPVLVVEISDFDLESDAIRFDLAALLSKSDVAAVDPAGGFAGCASIASDPDCQTFFSAYGLGASTQTWISAVPK